MNFKTQLTVVMSILTGSLFIVKPVHALVVGPIFAIGLVKFCLFLVGTLAAPITTLILFLKKGSFLKKLLITLTVLVAIFSISYFLFKTVFPELNFITYELGNVDMIETNTQFKAKPMNGAAPAGLVLKNSFTKVEIAKMGIFIALVTTLLTSPVVGVMQIIMYLVQKKHLILKKVLLTSILVGLILGIAISYFLMGTILHTEGLLTI
ncbi:MAG: hypothetical protein ACOZAO_01085 [Patescibacteria group bacterium]